MERAAIVVAGGSGSRLGGVDKPALVVGGRSLLDRALDATAGMTTVVVGPRRAVGREVVWTREQPAGGGPMAAVRAGIDRLSEMSDDAVVVLLAADLPAVVPEAVEAVTAIGGVLVDAAGEPQWLFSAWPLSMLRQVVPEDAGGLSLRRVLGPHAGERVPDRWGAARDIDTPGDLREFGG
ncbi:molybdenum cofactor guanylyltransferase [Actinokineospora bangkokensis]|uniref:MobA-like NTP transferase domain-containing protein n=1 Tax=Actinokineospora bangkokensis TaxID=1193682 RepID=A0A1Q9LRF3_9PSEU|nr:NTP transferase domain-containing protein [Actinokineospora bangkokensis]OLR94571.1 hypothetical protein BJP25_12600 [Actinokineospora bangkokensis]